MNEEQKVDAVYNILVKLQEDDVSCFRKQAQAIVKAIGVDEAKLRELILQNPVTYHLGVDVKQLNKAVEEISTNKEVIRIDEVT